MATYGTIHFMSMRSLLYRCLKKPQNSELPQDAASFELWVQEILRRGDFLDSIPNRSALARALMHLPNDISHKPISYFVTSLKRSHAQFAAFDELSRLKHQEETEAQEALAQAKEGHEHGLAVAPI